MEMRDNIGVYELMSDWTYYISCLESPKTYPKYPLTPTFFLASSQKGE